MRVLRQCLLFALYLWFRCQLLILIVSSMARSPFVEEIVYGPFVGCEMCVPDGVTSSKTDPLRNWSVLLLCASKLLLGSEGLVALQIHRVSRRSCAIVVSFLSFLPPPSLPPQFLIQLWQSQTSSSSLMESHRRTKGGNVPAS